MYWLRYLLAASVAFGAGCAARKPQTYRLAPPGSSHVLIPPGVATPEVSQGAFTVELPNGRPTCTPAADAIASQWRSGKLRVAVTRDALLQQPPGWLSQWTADAETRGCLPAGTGMEFAQRIVESIPLDPSAAYRLLHADTIRQGYVELGLENRLKAQAPIMKSGSAPDAPALEIASTSGNNAGLTVDVRASDNLLGVETSWYKLQPKATGAGTNIVALSTEQSIGGKIAPAAAPLKNYFEFAPQIGFYRMIYKADGGGNGAITEIVVGAPDRVELDRRTRLILADPDKCKVSDPEMCAVIPRRVALNPFLAVTVNGQETRLDLRASVRSAIHSAGGPNRAEDVLPQLSILKPYGGKLVPVEFDRTTAGILDLTLLGGESISWK